MVTPRSPPSSHLDTQDLPQLERRPPHPAQRGHDPAGVGFAENEAVAALAHGSPGGTAPVESYLLNDYTNLNHPF